MLPSRYKQVQNKTQQNPYVGLGMVAHSCNPVLRSRRQEDQESLRSSSATRPAWDQSVTLHEIPILKTKTVKEGTGRQRRISVCTFYQCKMFSIQCQMKSNLQQYIESSPYLIQKLKKKKHTHTRCPQITDLLLLFKCEGVQKLMYTSDSSILNRIQDDQICWRVLFDSYQRKGTLCKISMITFSK